MGYHIRYPIFFLMEKPDSDQLSNHFEDVYGIFGIDDFILIDIRISAVKLRTVECHILCGHACKENYVRNINYFIHIDIARILFDNCYFKACCIFLLPFLFVYRPLHLQALL